MSESVLRARFEHRFGEYDTDGDGTVGAADFTARADRLVQALGQSIDGPRAQAVREGARAYWAGVAEGAGVSGDAPLSREEFVRALLLARTEGTLRSIVEPSVRAHVALVDTDGNGTVDRDEFTRSQLAVGHTREQAAVAFRALDRDGDGTVDVGEWLSAVLDFYTHADAGAPGEAVLGLTATGS